MERHETFCSPILEVVLSVTSRRGGIHNNIHLDPHLWDQYRFRVVLGTPPTPTSRGTLASAPLSSELCLSSSNDKFRIEMVRKASTWVGQFLRMRRELLPPHLCLKVWKG